MTSALLDTVHTGSGYADLLIVSELGLGISRGSMNYGRLYQGKYIPPHRTDGLLPQSEVEENVGEEMCVEEDTDIAIKSSAEIDLD